MPSGIAGSGRPAGASSMDTPREFLLQPLSWHRTGTSPEWYQLRAIPGGLGTVTFLGRHEAIAETAHASWRFRPTGFFRPRTSILLEPGGTLVGSLRRHRWKSGGILEIPPDVRLQVAPSRWDTSFRILTATGTLVLGYDLRGLFSLHAPVEWGEAPEAVGRFAWLIYFSWYLAVRHYREVVSAQTAAIT